MSSVRIVLRRLPGKFSICKLPGKDPIPDWATGPDFMAIARSKDELSIVCSAEGVPVGTQSSGGWCCLQFAGPFAFDQAGVVLSVIRPISERGIGIFIVSTFDTDYLLLQDADFVHAKALLEDVGHTVEQLLRDHVMWSYAVFSKNQERLPHLEVEQRFVAKVNRLAKNFMSDEHFTVKAAAGCLLRN